MTTLLHTLDNPIWHALNGPQAHLSEAVTDTGEIQHADYPDAHLSEADRKDPILARRFLHDIGPLCGLSEQSPKTYDALARLAHPDEPLVLFLDTPAVLPAAWTMHVEGLLTQMVCEEDLRSDSGLDIKVLGDDDIPDMLALTRLTQPGPFRTGTRHLGTYVGIRQEGRLAAMAGERLHLDGYTEISAVCTHPDFQGRGYARALIKAVAENITTRGETPFLHTRDDNFNAIRVYEKLGFRQRRLLHLAVIKLKPEA